jgi:FtsH-binding integral membrane protein
MNMMPNRSTTYTEAVGFDAGLRSYMLKIYNLMAGALALTGVVAFFTAQSPAMLNLLFNTPLKWVIMLAPLGMSLVFSFRLQSMSISGAKMLFWAFAGVMGLSMSSIFIVFTGQDIARAFFITAATFGSMSLYGYTTKRDLSGFGSFLIMGVFGILIASLVNLFMQSSAMQMAISVLSVLIFTGLTAYDTQKLKHMYYAFGGEMRDKLAIMGALNLYFDFIIIFQNLLQLMNSNRE